MSDWLKIRITSEPGNSFLDRMIALVEGASRKKTPNEIALNTLLVSLTIIFLIVAILACTPLVKTLGEVLQERAASESKALTLMNVINVAGPILLLLLSTAALVGDSYNPFLYFRF